MVSICKVRGGRGEKYDIQDRYLSVLTENSEWFEWFENEQYVIIDFWFLSCWGLSEMDQD